MARTQKPDAASIIAAASSEKPAPAPAPKFPQSVLALQTLIATLKTNQAERAELIPQSEGWRADLDDRIGEIDLSDDKAVASLALFATKATAAERKVAILSDRIETLTGQIANLARMAHRDTLPAAVLRAHGKLQRELANKDGKTREEVINSATADQFRLELSTFRTIAPSGASHLTEAERVVRMAETIFTDLAELEHELGTIRVPAPDSDWLNNQAPEQRNGRHR